MLSRIAIAHKNPVNFHLTPKFERLRLTCGAWITVFGADWSAIRVARNARLAKNYYKTYI